MKISLRNFRSSLAFTILAGVYILCGCSFGSTANIDAGMKAIAESDYESAIASFDKAEKNGEDSQLLWRGKGIASMGLSDYPEAIKDLKKALSFSDGRVTSLEYDICQYLAVAQYKSGDKEGAVETYTSILSLEPKNSDALYLRGKTYLGLGETDAAIDDFNAAVKCDAKNPDLYINIYESLSDAGFAEQGDTYLKSAMELTELSEFQKGKLYFWRKEYENARDSFESAGKSDASPDIILYLGRTYEALGDISYAASMYKDYLKKNPGDVSICNQLGVCEMTNGDYKEALAAFEQGIAVNDNEIMQSLKYNQIVAYEYLSDFKKAAVLMEAYLKDYPDDEKAKREYTFLSTR
ncbi:MAG: tetratricopeptide repeat protein [Lachnospiraceae bacterium]|nr:tetratricopeptide repeat protein [Lachnospiraceae bacterium]